MFHWCLLYFARANRTLSLLWNQCTFHAPEWASIYGICTRNLFAGLFTACCPWQQSQQSLGKQYRVCWWRHCENPLSSKEWTGEFRGSNQCWITGIANRNQLSFWLVLWNDTVKGTVSPCNKLSLEKSAWKIIIFMKIAIAFDYISLKK